MYQDPSSEVFQSLLHTFALEHSSTIKSNPTFQAEFARLCNAIGVDPLAASNVKGKNCRRGESGSFWSLRILAITTKWLKAVLDHAQGLP
jgi:hypothetical protein